ncbi:MAG: methyltransferase family protein [Shimia sp.]
MEARTRIPLALGYGALTHLTFVAGVGSMIYGMWFGMTPGLGPLDGPSAWVANAILLLQFPVAHSFLVSARGRRWLSLLSPGPASAARTLATTTYALIASVQLLATFWLWSPSGVVWWQAETLWPFVLAYGAAWAFLGAAILNGGPLLQSGALGWTALLRDRAPRFPELPDWGLYAVMRNPIYLAFALTLWTVPIWTPDQLVVALTWTAYCVAAPRLKERRYLAIYGRPFEAYRARVPYFLPVPRRDP